MAQGPAPGVQLYLYRLLTEAFGTGRQALMPKVADALAADGIAPADLGCADVRELLSLLDFATLTDFRGGRTYATFSSRHDFDEALAALADAEPEAPKARKGGRPWKRKRAALKPIRPQHREARRPGPEPKPEAEAGTRPEPDSPQADDDPRPTPTDGAPVEEEPVASAPGIPDGPAPEPDEEPAREEPPVARTLAEILAEARAEEAAREKAATEGTDARESVAPHGAGSAADVAEEVPNPPVSAAGATPAGADGRAAGAGAARGEAPAPGTTSREPRATPATRELPRGLPVSFWEDVRCPDELLAKLANLLPLDADAHTVVEEDWRVARATGSVEADRTTARFELRYRDTEGGHVSLGIRRWPGAGKRWVVESVEGDAARDAMAGTPAPRPTAPDRLPDAPLVAGAAWAELSAAGLPAYRQRNLAHEFAEAVAIDGWGSLCTSVAAVAADEPWGPEGADGLPYLHEYLLVGLTRASEQGRLAALPGGGAVWNTGLASPAGEAVCCLFGTPRTDGARPLVDVCDGSDARPSPIGLPLPATYVDSLADVLVAPGTRVEVAPRARLSGGLAKAALSRAVASWRAAATVWDPQDRRCKLLLPASTTGAGIDAALLAEREPGHPDTLVAQRLLPLDVAHACARVVSGDLPAWLG